MFVSLHLSSPFGQAVSTTFFSTGVVSLVFRALSFDLFLRTQLRRIVIDAEFIEKLNGRELEGLRTRAVKALHKGTQIPPGLIEYVAGAYIKRLREPYRESLVWVVNFDKTIDEKRISVKQTREYKVTNPFPHLVDAFPDRLLTEIESELGSPHKLLRVKITSPRQSNPLFEGEPKARDQDPGALVFYEETTSTQRSTRRYLCSIVLQQNETIEVSAKDESEMFATDSLVFALTAFTNKATLQLAGFPETYSMTWLPLSTYDYMNEIQNGLWIDGWIVPEGPIALVGWRPK